MPKRLEVWAIRAAVEGRGAFVNFSLVALGSEQAGLLLEPSAVCTLKCSKGCEAQVEKTYNCVSWSRELTASGVMRALRLKSFRKSSSTICLWRCS